MRIWRASHIDSAASGIVVGGGIACMRNSHVMSDSCLGARSGLLLFLNGMVT